jgi:hypothetical protein
MLLMHEFFSRGYILPDKKKNFYNEPEDEVEGEE